MSKNYLDSISDAEAERLGMQHRAWKPETDAFLRQAGFPAFRKIVDFGCGPGLTACDIAREIAPSADVLGVDISDLYLRHLGMIIEKERVTNLKTVKADLTGEVDIGTYFDGAFCRWFLAWVAKDLDAVLGNVFRVLRPGGTFAAMEYLTLRSTVSSPPSLVFDHMVEAWEQFYVQCGGTTEIGARLPEALVKAGFKIRKMQVVGGFSASGDRLFNWWKRLNEDFNQAFVQKNLLSLEQVAALQQFWDRQSGNPNAFIYSPLLLQIEAVVP